jgi:hypothetical protein
MTGAVMITLCDYPNSARFAGGLSTIEWHLGSKVGLGAQSSRLSPKPKPHESALPGLCICGPFGAAWVRGLWPEAAPMVDAIVSATSVAAIVLITGSYIMFSLEVRTAPPIRFRKYISPKIYT